VFGQIDDSHAAFAKLANDSVLLGASFVRLMGLIVQQVNPEVNG
jgi:hypothetical protein